MCIYELTGLQVENLLDSSARGKKHQLSASGNITSVADLSSLNILVFCGQDQMRVIFTAERQTCILVTCKQDRKVRVEVGVEVRYVSVLVT